MRTALVLPALVLAACTEPEGSAKLSGAYFQNLPVFEPSDVVETDEAFYGAGSDFSDLKDYHARIWTLATNAPLEDVIAFYERVCPPIESEDEDHDPYAGFDEDDEDDEGAHFIYRPPGEGDDTEVTIDVDRDPDTARTRFVIFESVLDSRRK